MAMSTSYGGVATLLSVGVRKRILLKRHSVTVECRVVGSKLCTFFKEISFPTVSVEIGGRMICSMITTSFIMIDFLSPVPPQPLKIRHCQL